MLFTMALGPLSMPGTAACSEPEWTSSNRYRILLNVDPQREPRSCSPASIDLDIEQALAELGMQGTFDPHSVEVVGYTSNGATRIYDASRIPAERVWLPFRIDHDYGLSRVRLHFVMPDHACTRYAVYFDTVESGRGRPERYTGLVGDGDWFRGQYKRREIAASKMDAFCDLDNDGDLDLFKVTVEPFIYCYENVGGNRFVGRGRLSSGGKLFTLPYDGFHRSWATLAFNDWDEDGDQDLFVGFATGSDPAYRNQFIGYENVSIAGGAPEFIERGQLRTVSDQPVGSEWFATMRVVDWDGDGKLDVLASQRTPPREGRLHEYHRILFYRSAGRDPWALRLADGIALEANGEPIEIHSPDVETADIDTDGDPDLFTATQRGEVSWYENIGTASSPELAAGEDIASSDGHSGVKVADFDGDGLPDFAVADVWGGMPEPEADRRLTCLYKNVGTADQPRFEPRDALEGAPFTEEHQICFAGRQNTVRVVDWNEDDKPDLLASTAGGSIYVFLNRTGRLFPEFSPGELILKNPGPSARSDVCDWNNDGRKDLIVANVQGEVRWYENIGTHAAPSFPEGTRLETNGKPIDGTHWGSVLVCDWNNDGRKDLLLGMGGEGNGSVDYDWPHLNDEPSQDRGFLFYRNVGTDAAPALAAPTWITAGGEVITYVRPNLGSYVDWDGDGRMDLIACEFENVIRLYRNTGSGRAGEEPNLAPASGTVIVQPWTAMLVSGAHAVDWNGDGDLDIVTGQGHGGSGLRFFERDHIEDTIHGTPPRVTVEAYQTRPSSRTN